MFPDVYVPKDAALTRQEPGQVGSGRIGKGVIAGLTASALHGAKWVDDHAPIELIWPNARPATGLRTYDVLALPTNSELDGMRVTTPARTGFDIARRKPLDAAVANLDALGNATALSAEEYFWSREIIAAAGLRQLARCSIYTTRAPRRQGNLVAALGDSGGLPDPKLRYR